MESLSYQQFIDELNRGKIIKVVFKVKNYAHYKNCSIESEVFTFNTGESVINFHVKLAKSYEVQCGHIYENFLFFGKFDENRKLFKMGRRGTFNLKQMWDKIEFISIEYAS